MRLYVFYDRKILENDSLIIAAYGGEKGSQKRDIKAARDNINHYKALLEREDTTLNLVELEV